MHCKRPRIFGTASPGAVRIAAALAACAALLAAAPAVQAQQKPIRFGAIYIMSGSAAAYGQFAKQGIELAADEINKKGGILGRQVEFALEDGQGKVDVAIQAARKLVFQGGADALMGLDSSGVANGLTPIVPELRKPFVITHAASPDVTGKLCNAYTYRVSVNVNQNMGAAAQIAAESGAKRWTTIGPDYAFGHQSWEYFGKYLKQRKPDVELMQEVAFPRFGAEDFVPFINSVMQSKPDGVLISLWGGDLVNFVRQAKNLGFFEQKYQVLLTLGAAVEVLSALGEQMPQGVWAGTRYWFAAHDNPINNAFVQSYLDRFGAPPSYNAEGAYAAMYLYKAAMEKAGSVDGAAVAKALAGMSFDAPNGRLTIRAGDHQAVVGPTWGKLGAFDSKYKVRMLDAMRTFKGEDVTPTVAETGCKL
ncbi:MAG: ABC transporter substrate-binding protein [Burkholderiaceae bacterium]|nr:ABC transporter substrate-binding protein [Burkholderiaceae bacterium]